MPCLRRCSTAAIHSMPCIDHQVFCTQAMGNSPSPPPAQETRQKACVKELPAPNSVARIGADAPSSVHRRRCALVFPTHSDRAARPEPKAPCLHNSARPHCCSLKSVVRRCNKRCSRGKRAPVQMRACPDFGATRISHPCAESELAASRNRAPRAAPHPAPPRAAANGAPPVRLA